MEECKHRKTIRYSRGNYNRTGYYFLTICTKDRRCLLSRVVGTGVLDGPSDAADSSAASVKLTRYGEIAEKYLRQMDSFYANLSVKRYVIMPNHIHLILCIESEGDGGPSGTPVPTGGTPWDDRSMPVPTRCNSVVSRFVSTFKRFCNREFGQNLWQARSHDHIIRSRRDYEEHVRYICENPMRWRMDELYCDE